MNKSSSNKVSAPFSNSIPIWKRTETYIEIFIWIIFSAAMVFKTAHFQFSVKINVKSLTDPSTLYMLAGTLSSALFIIGTIFLIFNRKRLPAVFVIDLALSILFFSDSLYYKYYYNVISIPTLVHFGLVSSVGDSIKSLIAPSDLLIFIDLPFILLGILLIKKQIKARGNTSLKLRLKKKLLIAAALFAACAGIFYPSYTKVPYTNFIYDNNYVVNSLGLPYFHYYDAKRFVIEHLIVDDNITTEETKAIRTYFDEKEAAAPADKKYENSASGKNLIVIQMEAMQNFLINREYNGKEITPNMNALIKDFAYFDNYYYQIGAGNTSDAEFLTNNSLHPLSDSAVYFRYPDNYYESTGNLLTAKGYNTYALHANTPSFWNRTEMYKSEGFSRFFCSQDFVQDDPVGWGLSDKSFFRQSLDMIDTSSPFYSFYITLSSHHPFANFKDYTNFDSGEYQGTLLGNYLKAANYEDAAIGGFIQDLKDRGLYENSVIVIYGDHYAITQTLFESLSSFLGCGQTDFDWVTLQKTPCFIRFPGMAESDKGIKSITCGEIDILPTVSNLLGLDSPHTLGNDLFNTEKGSVILSNSNVISDDFIYLYENDSLYDSKGNLLSKDEYKEYTDEIQKKQKELEISDLIIKKNGLEAIGR